MFKNFRARLAIKARREAPVFLDEFESADALDEQAPDPADTLRTFDAALEDLRSRHLSFRAPEKSEESTLDELRLAILTAVTQSDMLQAYYYEAWDVPEARWQKAEMSPASAYRPIAMMQIELMTRAFYVLQLQRFANAPENLGWMTLFRAWGRSPSFNAIVDEVRTTLDPKFEKFFRYYLCRQPRFASAQGNLPIHHPWLMPSSAASRRTERRTAAEEPMPAEPLGRGLYMDAGIMEGHADVELRPGTGGVDDPNSGPGADKPQETPSDGGEPSGGSPVPNA